MLRSGLTSAPSIQNLGVEKWISSLEDSHASHIQWRETSSEKMTQENSAERSSESPTGLDFQTSFLKMFQESCDSTTKTSDQDFKAWATPLRKDSLRRRKQAHLTEDKGSSSWPTPQNKDYKRENLPAWEARQQRKAKEGINLQQNLCIATLKNWPTPASRDWKGFDPPGKQNTKSDPKMYLSIPQAPATTKDGLGSSTDGPSLPQPSAKNHRCSTKCRRLNANFAAHLMGLPKNYLLKSCCVESAMESFQQWQHSLSENLARL